MWVGDFARSALFARIRMRGARVASALMARVIDRMLRAGQTPFLHVRSSNARAINVYRALGFIRRTEYPLLHAKRIS